MAFVFRTPAIMGKGLSIERLQTFLKVAEAQGLARASDHRKSSETQFSRQIKELELHVGVPLFDRSMSPLRLTPTGEKLAGIVREFFTQMEDLQADCERRAKAFRVGAGDRLLHWLLIPVLPRIQESVPDCVIHLHNCPSKVLVERIRTQSLDLGIVRTREVPHGMHSVVVANRLDYALFHPGVGPLAEEGLKAVLKRYPLAIVERYQEPLVKSWTGQGMEPQVRLICSTFPQAKRAVTAGYAAVLPLAAFTEVESLGIRSVPLPGETALLQDDASISLVTHAGAWEARLQLQAVFKAALAAFGMTAGPASGRA